MNSEAAGTEWINQIKQLTIPDVQGGYSEGWNCALVEVLEIIKRRARNVQPSPDVDELQKTLAKSLADHVMLKAQLADAKNEIKDLKRGGMSWEDATCGDPEA